ncbi:lysosomal acid phosphatase-like isoform X5 [Hypanus sabinus]|uniref:lysosomal acid phosphatase-like isoform X5 n=1 Tax=Hypanus sabinus TaxID=79690 RepID=UPI0028C4932B|nr:lysosomal acid phosphatase-like isoform X5 [Hypanus sabinus]
MAGVEAAVLRSPALLCVLMLLGLQRPVAGRALKFVNLIYRHGDRSPIQAYPADPYTEKDWPQGFAQLTQVGMKQHYALGQYLRHRYNTFLNSSYDRHEVYVQSTDIDRTLMSAQVNLAGLYIPQGHQIFHPDVKWQPIPVHTVPVEQDEFLKFPRKNCPRFQKLLEETMNSREVREKIQKNTHDVTLIALQMALNVYNYIIPPYASCFMFELYEEDDRKDTSNLLDVWMGQGHRVTEEMKQIDIRKETVMRRLMGLKADKSPGPDGLHPKGSFEDPDLELHAGFGSLWEWDPCSGIHDWLLFNMPSVWPESLNRVRKHEISGLWRWVDRGSVSQQETRASLGSWKIFCCGPEDLRSLRSSDIELEKSDKTDF